MKAASERGFERQRGTAKQEELGHATADADDPVTEGLTTVLADEEAHRTEFRGYRKEC